MSILFNVFRQALRSFKRADAPARGADDDLQRIIARFPPLVNLPEAAAASGDVLADAYREYVTTVSHPVWALSPPLAQLLHGACVLLKPQAVLDTGSGFSSYILRLYARDAAPSCTVHSVDLDPAWLERTRGFLASHRLPTDGLYLWEDFRQRAASRYQLIVHDLGRTDLRLEALAHVLALAAPGGVVILDDMHKPEYAPHAVECCRKAGFEIRSLRALTLDQIGRYACLAFRRRGR